MEFEQVYDLYFRDVYRYILKLSGSEHVAEEITSGTFFKALRSIGKFRGSCDMRVWLCQIAKNCYYTYLRKEKHTTPLEELPESVGSADTPEELIGAREEAGVLRTLKKKLRKQTWCAIAITAAVVLLVTLMLRINPIDYLADVSSAEQYTFSDRMALLFKGDYSDQDKAEAVLSNAHIVFEYPEEEIYNDVLAMPRDEAAYAMGALVRYCVPEMDAGKVLTIYHIDLLSAHFSGDSGKMWVKYGYQRFDKTHDLSTCTSTGAIDHIVLWKLEKYGDGYWRVVEIV